MAKDPYKYFRVEAQELLEGLSRGVLALEQGATPDLVAQLLRLAHTLKGAARAVKRPDIANLAHAIEDALAPLRGSTTVSRDRIDGLLKLLDSIREHVSALGAPPAKDGGTAPRVAPEESLRAVRTDRVEMDALLEGVAEATAQLESMRPMGGALGRARQLADLLAGQLSAMPAGEPRQRVDAVSSLKIQALGDALRRVMSELHQNFMNGLNRVEREIRQVHETAERLLLLPAGVMFGALERTTRDVAQAQGKRANFHGRGKDICLDAQVLGVVQGALLQVMRNAVAHGIETEAERLAAGKPPAGRVDVEVVRRATRVAFVCRDDGRGIDLEAVRRVAEQKGLPVAQAQLLGSAELLQLLLKGGLTTSDAVTEVAGRGVGLDVVREAADRLGGQVLISTDAGRGTTLELIVPISLSSVDALLLQAGTVVAALPLDGVRETVRIAPRDVVQTADGHAILHEGGMIPFARLAPCLDRRAPASPESRACSAVVVEGRSGRAAVGVDRLLGTANVVLRPLPAWVPAEKMIAGASFDAEGTPRLVLDADGLLATLAAVGRQALAEPTPPPPVLVIDDSLTTRMLEQSVLESAGYDVDLAASAAEALVKARARRYGLFLLDVEMPGMDGFGFMEKARTDAALRDVPTILVTSRDSREDRQRGQELGACAYVAKSEFDQRELLALIGKLLR